MRINEISKSEFVDRLNDPRHALVQAKLYLLKELIADWGWSLTYNRIEGDELSYDILMKVVDREKRDQAQATSSKVRLAFTNVFWHDRFDRQNDLVIRVADKTPTRVVMWVMHDEEKGGL